MQSINENVDNIKTNIDIVNLKIEDVYPNPDNPRKNLGDLTEMVESVKKNGIMQNLTVVPGHKLESKEWSPEGYTLIIGHRRRAAAELAGIKELPCRIIEDMDAKTQFSTMLEENMQRNDLTIIEQANGFQMMLDLGETVESIVEKTGFSRATVHHRLNIAKLDQRELKKKQEDESFQLSLKDLYALEQIKDIKVRNRVLKEASNSSQLIWKASQAVKEIEKQEKIKQIVRQLEKLGVKKAPDGAEHEQWSDKWEQIKDFELDKDVPKNIKLKQKPEELVYFVYYNFVRVMKKAVKKAVKKTAAELEREQLEKNKKTIKSLISVLNKRKSEFIKGVVTGELQAIKETPELKDELWHVLVSLSTYLTDNKYISFLCGKSVYDCSKEDREDAKKKYTDMSVLHQMLIYLDGAMDNAGDIYDYYGCYKENLGSNLLSAYEILIRHGFSFNDENEEKVINGTHECYKKQEEL